MMREHHHTPSPDPAAGKQLYINVLKFWPKYDSFCPKRNLVYSTDT